MRRIVFLLLLGLSVRLYHLGHQNLWIDEVFHLRVSSQAAADIVENYRLSADRTLRDQAPLSFLVTHAFLSPRDLEWSVRLPAAIFGTLTVLGVFLVARELVPPSAAFLSAFFLAVSPLHVWHSQDARWYAQFVCFVTLSYAAFVWACKTRRLGAWASYAVVTLLCVYTFIFSFFVIACQALSVWLAQRAYPQRPRFFLRFLALQIGLLIAAVPVLCVILGQVDIASGTPRPTTAAVLGYTVFAYSAGFSFGPTLAYLHALPGVLRVIADHPVVALVLAIFVPLVGLGVRRAWHFPQAALILLPWLVGPPLLVFLTASLTHVVYEVRYTIGALPAFFVLLALGVDAIETRALRWGAIAVLLACFASSLANHYWNSAYAKEDVRGALAHVTAARAGGVVAPVVTMGQVAAAVRHYGRGLDLVSLPECNSKHGTPKPFRLAAQEEVPALWLLVGRDWDGEAARCLTGPLRSYAVVERQGFAGVDLLRLSRRRAGGVLAAGVAAQRN